MRTLKVLSLVLALVLCFGLVGTAFAAPANFEGYTDAAKIGDAYIEAADVLMGIGVIEGKTDTTIDPTGNFTREQAAKIIAYMLMGKTAADKLVASAAPFADVKADRWSAGFISFCADQGIVSGVGNGNFNPTGTLTGYQFAKMLLAAVGYNANGEYEGAAWSVNVAKDAIQQGVFDGDLASATNAPIQRQQAILMAFNTLMYIPRVTYSDLLKQYVAYGAGLLGTAVAPAFLRQNFGVASVAQADDSGAAGHIWKIGTREVSDWYRSGVALGTEKALGTLNGNAIYRKYTLDAGLVVLVNGEAIAADAAAIIAAATAGNLATPLALYNGYAAEFVDADYDGDVDEIIITIEYIAQVTAAAAATANADASITITVFDGVAVGGYPGIVITEKDYDFTALGLKRNDYIVITPDQISAPDFVRPISIEKAEGTVAVVASYVPMVSVTYNSAPHFYAFNYEGLKNGYAFAPGSYTFFTNSNGALLGSFAYAPAATPLNYIYVTAAQCEGAAAGDLYTGSNGASAKIQGILVDGTTKVFDAYITTNPGTGAKSVEIGGAGAVSCVIPANTAAGTALPAFPGLNQVYSYTLTDKGQIILSTDTLVNIGGVVYDASASTTAIATTKGSAEVGFTSANDAAVKYATMGTKLTVVTNTGAKTVYEGYDKFPGSTAAAQAFPTFKFGVYADNLLTDIVVTGFAAPAAVNTTTLIYTGASYQALNAQNVASTFYTFRTMAGETVNYTSAVAPVAKSVYAATITGDAITAGLGAPIATAAGVRNVYTGVVITEVTDTYVVAGGTVIYTNASTVVTDVRAASAASWTAGTLVAGRTITAICSTTDNAQYIFITA